MHKILGERNRQRRDAKEDGTMQGDKSDYWNAGTGEPTFRAKGERARKTSERYGIS